MLTKLRSTVFASAVLLAACGGDKSASTPADSASNAAPAAGAPAAGAPAVASATAGNGAELYQRCAVCHQASGEGLPGTFPPLAGSEWVNGPASRPIAILLHGLQGEITVKGNKFANQMMPYGTNVPMSDAEIAAVLTYVRSNFGNTAPAVTGEEVAKVRASLASRTTPLTQKDLEALQ